MDRVLLLKAVILAVFGTLLADSAITKSFDVTTFITFRFAETTITSEVINDQDENKEITFQTLLPKEAFISEFSMTIDGETFEAIVEEKVKANKTFEAAKRLNKTAGLVQTRETSDKTFKTSVNVAAGVTVQFKLVYQQLLRRIRGKYRHQIILLGSQLSDVLTINTYICEGENIKNVTVPSVLASDGTKVTPKFSININPKTNAHIEYVRGENVELQSKLSSSGGSFQIEYELENTPEGGRVIVDNGHFAYFYAPDVEIRPRRVVFVLDVSGSMFGLKIQQLKTAMLNIVDKLTDQDRFSIITFQSGITQWGGNLVQGTARNIELAQDFIRRMAATGGTNIHDALKTAIDLLNKDSENEETIDSKENYIVFLTDGQPTAGITSVPTILDNVKTMNGRFAIHAIGFGSNVDKNFLSTLSAQNNGTWTHILVDINAALQIQNYLDELSLIFLSNITFEYPDDVVEDFVPPPNGQFGAGGELMAFGRFKDDIDPRNRGPFSINLIDNSDGTVISAQFYLDQKPPSCTGLVEKSISNFGSKVFGLRKVSDILQKYNAATNDLLKEELKEEAINNALHYKLVTTLTSLIIVKPKDLKGIEQAAVADKPDDANIPIARPVAPKPNPGWKVQGDPHFMIRLNENITACFNWLGRSGEIFSLLNDPKNNIVINGLVDGPELTDTTKNHAIFISTLVVLLGREHIKITINAEEAIVDDISNARKRGRALRLPMVNMEDYEATYGHVKFLIRDVTDMHTLLHVIVGGNISFIVNLHHVSKFNPNKFDHLDLMISGSEKMSSHAGGIFGRFPKNSDSKGTDQSVSIMDVGDDKTLLWYNDRVTPVRQTSMIVPYLHRLEECWFVAKPEAILGVSMESFVLQSLTEVPKRLIGRR